MTSYDYKNKILEFSREIKQLLQLDNANLQTDKLINMIHKMLFYAEQYFIERELEFRNYPSKVRIIRSERQEVLSMLQGFAETVKYFNNEVFRMLDFLDQWQNKLRDQEVSSQIQ